ncbi:MAG TPA: RHS repeat-associated core domain-containing protein [Hyphomicrobiaceae bacterium]|nr:RHS repeat-associated core domain-containing protein [Hyphomicrobiaceae bacterium]
MTSAVVWAAPLPKIGLGMNGSATMGYDPAGRRDRLTISGPAGTRTSFFFADGENTVAEFSGLWDVSALLRRFIYAPGASTPFLVVERATGAKTFLHADRLGSIIATASNDGAITGQAKYSPYGVTAGSIPTIFGYTGHQYDREIGIYYARARTYMPMLGRFMQVDPVGYKQSLNLYTYGLGNPVAHTDPSGAFIGLIIPFAQFLLGEISASAFVSTLIETVLTEGLLRGLDYLSPGAGTAVGTALSIYGLGQSVFAGSGPGKVVEFAGGAVKAGAAAIVPYLTEGSRLSSYVEPQNLASVIDKAADESSYTEDISLMAGLRVPRDSRYTLTSEGWFDLQHAVSAYEAFGAGPSSELMMGAIELDQLQQQLDSAFMAEDIFSNRVGAWADLTYKWDVFTGPGAKIVDYLDLTGIEVYPRWKAAILCGNGSVICSGGYR